MSTIQTAWERHPDRGPRDHAFQGPILVSTQLADHIVLEEVAHLITLLRDHIAEHGLVGPVQIFDNRYSGIRIYWANYLSQSAIKSGLFSRMEILENNHSMMMTEEDFRNYKRASHNFQYLKHGVPPQES